MAGSRLSQFTKIEPAHWKILEKIKTRDGGNCNLLNIERSYPENIKRTFCKCGYASGKLEDSCPVCGNSHVYSFQCNSTSKRQLDDVNDIKIESVYSPLKKTNEDRVVYYKDSIYAEASSSNEFVFEETGFIKVVELGEYEAIEHGSSHSCRLGSKYYYTSDNSDFKEVMSKYPYDLEGFNKFKDNKSVSGLISFINFRTELPIVVQNIKKYPKIVNYILGLANTSDYKKISSWDEVYPLLGVPERKLYPYIESLVCTRGYHYRHSKVEDAFEHYNRLNDEKKSIADYFLMHGDCDVEDYTDLTGMLEIINSKETPIVAAFVRANYVSLGKNVLMEYTRRADHLRNLGVDVNITNMDTRNYNLYKNKEYMVENKKYNEKKVSYFLEMFELNPLESLKYLDSRRAPNKELKKELAEKLD